MALAQDPGQVAQVRSTTTNSDPSLAAGGGMFVVTEADAAAVRAVFNQEGELSAAIELRRRFPGVTDDAKARAYARTIAGWMPRPEQPHPVTRLRPRKDS
jgi:hypothetical protein